jgi:hypothetical protein
MPSAFSTPSIRLTE